MSQIILVTLLLTHSPFVLLRIPRSRSRSELPVAKDLCIQVSACNAYWVYKVWSNFLLKEPYQLNLCEVLKLFSPFDIKLLPRP